ncbi:MAG: peptidoglycan-binding protein [Alphaproteobacteria bacterium]
MTRRRESGARRGRLAAGSPRTTWLAVVLLALLIAPLAARAADGDGRFAIKGAGGARCEAFVAARKARGEPYAAFRGWLNGYLTAFNQLSPETYDIAAWENTRLLAAVLENHCKKNPKQPLYLAVAGLINSLKADRVQKHSPRIEAKRGETTVTLYSEVLRRAQQALADRGFYFGTIDGVYGPNTRLGFEAFQRTEKLKVTGLPDPPTLYKLLR